MANPRNKDRKPRKPKPCSVCKQGIEYVDYKDLALLKPFLNERAKIKARRTSGVCAKHQVQLSGAIKNAREMSLIPYATR
ncbi:30S ribosomal protein S18 [Nitriliruptoraceae bacterium ZYF776]|nr:30S ribosomal protein S18 [Profundirhabdus halotolerans]